MIKDKSRTFSAWVLKALKAGAAERKHVDHRLLVGVRPFDQPQGLGQLPGAAADLDLQLLRTAELAGAPPVGTGAVQRPPEALCPAHRQALVIATDMARVGVGKGLANGLKMAFGDEDLQLVQLKLQHGSPPASRPPVFCTAISVKKRVRAVTSVLESRGPG